VSGGGKQFVLECITFSLSVEIEEKDFSSVITVKAIFLPFNILFVVKNKSYWSWLLNGIILID
jgi:hypothetical protein